MKTLISAMLLTLVSTQVWAGHSTDNGTCTDDAIHWQNMIDKRTDAPLWSNSKATQAKAMEQRVQGNWAECEVLMEEALRMIRKTDGEYATE